MELVHIETHQDDWTEFNLLSRPAQLNCVVDAGAKKCLLEVDASGLVVCCRFPLEPIACYMGKDEMTSDTGNTIQFWVHRRLAREALVDGKVLVERQFNAMAWEAMYAVLHSMPQMFQLWACKQVWELPVQIISIHNGTRW
jgi:hypothetical protein